MTLSPERMRELLALNREIAGATDYAALPRLIVERTAASLDANVCVLLLRGKRGEADVAASVGLDPARASGFDCPLDERIGSRLCGLIDCSEERFVATPVIERGEIRGVLAIHRRDAPCGETEEFMLSALSDHVAIALAHARQHRELEEALERLQEDHRRKDAFLTMLSHELRNPLAPISNSLHLLQRVEFDNAGATYALGVIRRQIDHMIRLVNDLLDISRINRGRVQLQIADVDLNELLSHSVQDYQSTFERAGIGLDLRLPAAPARVRGDAVRIAQMFGNLLSNAAKFTGRGGSATVTLDSDPAAGMAIVSIRDTGLGMDAQQLDAAFEPFWQSEQSLARSQGGLGLGLALVKGLAEMQGGSVSGWSQGHGQGTTFTVRLPLTRRKVPRPVASAPGTDLSHRRILIIEDNADAAETLRQLIELNGRHDIEVEHDGESGVANALSHAPDLVFCDLGLPGMDGYEVARTLRRTGDFEDCLLVAVSGYGLSEDVERAIAAGFDLHLTKPVRFELIEKVLLRSELGTNRRAGAATP
ncbi:ATP-binding protein [Aquabacterium sp. A7-Y]|uniref:hybrid sensor histidine kinase/response regulator n=1 Tax=Aquabacterium sp. A7-Y TaxID=1349605 RepID=UPI00223D45D9|nr:ATP-binding protein [Aquabacterium sp. A7-Y]MCW7541407.1 ATP-binding protein [Aquabacterium sp. A7-Y]